MGNITGNFFYSYRVTHKWNYLIELQLAHTERNAVSAAYNHATYLEPRRKLMQAWADYLESLGLR